MHWPLYLACLLVLSAVNTQNIERRVGSLQEVFAWRQLTYEINGVPLLRDQASLQQDDGSSGAAYPIGGSGWARDNVSNREKRQGEPRSMGQGGGRFQSNRRNNTQSQPTASPATRNASEGAGTFFIQYNNVPMGAERVGNRLFITVPRRRYGIPSTLNYVDLKRESGSRSPHLRPYPSLREGRSLISVYRTRADVCGRLWMVDTGMLEIPNNRQQIQPPSIVVFDMSSDRQLLRYAFKDSDLPTAATPTGLASITVDVTPSTCDDAFAYVPDLTTNGIIVFSLRERDSWRVTHNYFNFNPTAGNLNVAGLRFQWSDGIFSIALSSPNREGCRVAYFHPMVSTQEFSVSTCVLRNRTASEDANYWTLYNLVGERGEGSQSTCHGYHDRTRVLFFADIGRDSVSCWNTGMTLSPQNIRVLASDSRRLSYPSDLHVTGNEVWVMANSMPRFSYSRLDTTEYNFYVYRGRVQEMINNTVCGNDVSLSFSD